MCGRFVRKVSRKEMEEFFDVVVTESPARYNMAPSRPVAAVPVRPHEGNRVVG
jgi:putative SOS response-associated peptidase YedK